MQQNEKGFDSLVTEEPSKKDQQIEELQERLESERDARREDRFIFIGTVIILLDVVFFTVMPTFGGPLALVTLELLFLIPLAKRLGMEEIAQILSSVLHRVAGKASDSK